MLTPQERKEIRDRYYRLSVMPPRNIKKDLEKTKAYDLDIPALMNALDEKDTKLHELKNIIEAILA